MSSYRNYYDTTFGRTKADSSSKNISPSPSRIATKYGGAYTTSFSSSRDTARSEAPRLKSPLDRNTSHPPVSYKSSLTRTGIRSRDSSPSVVDKSDKSTSSSSSYLNPNRLYPRTYTKTSTSRESTVSPATSTSNLPKFTGTSSRASSKDGVSRYGARPSCAKDETSKYASRSVSASKEDVSSGSQKYLNSRFLPKNSVERSYTAYSRPSAARTHEVSRKNKELLNVLHAQQEQERLSRSPSRCSSVAPEEPLKTPRKIEAKRETPEKKPELETVKVCTRATSPTLGAPTQPSYLRSRRIEIAKTIEKTVTRQKTVPGKMIDKEIQSDRLDDSTRSSRFAGASRISATPWSSFLDMKFNSPNNKKGDKSKQDSCDSPKSLSRTSSTKSIASVKSDKEKDSKRPLNPSIKSKLTPPKQLTDKKLLPPPIPKSDSSSKSNALHSLNTPNKDFRKSVLNMNPDGTRKKLGRRSNSASSAESDNADPDATDVSETLGSSKSYHKSSSSCKLPQKSQRGRQSPSSDVSVSSTTGPSSSEDDLKTKKEKSTKSLDSSRTSVILTSPEEFSTDKSSKIPRSPKQKHDGSKNDNEAKSFLKRALAPVTNLFKGNRQSQGEVNRPEEHSDPQEKVVWILDPSSESVSQQPSFSEPMSAKIVLNRVESGDNRCWWEDSSETSSDRRNVQQLSEPVEMKYGEVSCVSQEFRDNQESNQLFAATTTKQSLGMRQTSSGEAPWWLDPNSKAPEGVKTYPDYSESNKISPTHPDPVIRHVQSGETPWWLDENSKVPEEVQTYPNWKPQERSESQQESNKGHVDSEEKPWWLEENCEPPEGINISDRQFREKAKIRPIDSGEAPWWLKKDETLPEGIQTYTENYQPNDSSWWQDSEQSSSEPKVSTFEPELSQKYKLRHIDSGERAWWMTDEESISEMVQAKKEMLLDKPKYAIRHQDSGEKAWWLQDNSPPENKDIDSENEFDSNQMPLGDRASPEGLEMPKDNEGRISPYDNVSHSMIKRNSSSKNNKFGPNSLFISKHTNIDDILGGTGQLWSPLANKIFGYDDEGERCKEIDAREVIIHEGKRGTLRGEKPGLLSPTKRTLGSSKSYHKSSSSCKLPQKSQRGRQSPSSDVSVSSTTGPSSSEDDLKTKKEKSTKSLDSSRTSVILTSPEEFSTDKSSKIPRSPKQKHDGSKNDNEAKSFLKRALAPVTNLFKGNRQSQGEVNRPEEHSDPQEKVVWILDPSSESVSQQPSFSEPMSAKIVLNRVESGDNRCWWEDSSETSSDRRNVQQLSEPVEMKYGEVSCVSQEFRDNQESNQLFAATTTKQSLGMRQTSSGEAPWWLDPNSKAPEGVKTYPDYSESNKISPTHPDPVIRHVQSGETPWWLDENSKVPEEVQTYPNWKPQERSESQQESNKGHVDSEEKPWWLEENCEPPEGINISDRQFREKAKIRPIDSGEAPWWLKKDETLPEGIQTYTENYQPNDSSWWQDSEQSSSEPKVSTFEPELSQKYKLRHIDSGERAWWMTDEESISEMVQAKKEMLLDKPKYAIRHQDSGEKAWWLQDNSPPENKDIDSENEFDSNQMPLGDRASPEGLEMPKDNEGRISPYDNVSHSMIKRNSSSKNNKFGPNSLFISKHTNIDDILGGTGQLWSPLANKIFGYDDEGERCKEIDAREVIIHEGKRGTLRGEKPGLLSPTKRLDDAALQLYKDGDYGSYLDLEASISEQQEEFEGFQSNKKNSIVLRTQLSVRVHTIIEKLLTSEGRELRRALFSLKQIFQEDKDLVHEFVQNDGLSCLIKVGSEADQNYQNYILRALGQVMLYVDGMNGVMEHNQTIQWLYSLISSKFRLVVKTALKLLLVFVEYTDPNCMLLVNAINAVDYSQGLLPYHNIMKLLTDFDSADTELLIYATTLINKVLSGVPEQDIYYDQVDSLEEQGMEAIIQRYMSKPGTDLDLLQQFQIYEAVLQFEDGEEKGGHTPMRHLDENIRKTLRSRKSMHDTTERRKSRRHSTGTTPLYGGTGRRNNNHILQEDYDESSTSNSSGVNNLQLNGSYKDSNKANDAGVTPALKRRRERAERQRSFMREQQETAALLKGVISPNNDDHNNIENISGNYTNALQQRIANGNHLNKTPSRKDLTPYLNAVNKMDSEENIKQPWIMMPSQDGLEESDITNENERNILMQLKKENTVKDLTQKLANQSIVQSPTDESKVSRFGDMSGLISKAKEGLAKSKSKADVMKNQANEGSPKIELKKSENELRWEELVANLNRSLNLCDMDFTDLATDDETDILAPAMPINGIPPPPPPFQMGNAPPPPPLANRAPPPVPNAPLFGVSLNRNNKNSLETKIPVKKNKKTVKLFWKEVRDDPISHSKLKTGYIWDEISPVTVDTQKLEHLFESRAKDLISKKQQELNKNKEIIVLDPKRSNAINIGMTKLPPPRSIKTAILKMDATIMNREGIEKLLTMLPTEEERTKIQEAQAANPDLPLGSAEQFLLTLASISELPARLKLWAFKLDFENSEREIAEPLMDLKQGFEVLKVNKTFRAILSTLLSIGNFLNGNEVKGFQIEYLTKVPEVKDTVHKHSLLHHLCHIVMEKFPEATDLYSEIGAITRASKVDFDELALNIQRLVADCKASWDHLKLIAKHEGSTMMKVKMSDFLADCAERIILLGIIHRRIINRFHKFLLWLGIPFHQVADTKPNEFSRIVSEFALEYRTTRERVLQQLEKKANHRERNKTRGKMITDIGKFRSKEDRADAELRQLLGSDISDVESMQGTLPWRHRRREGAAQGRTIGGSPAGANGHLIDGDDEILESLVKTATKGPRTAPRERKRTRHADRKSFKRSRTRENNPYGSRDSP